jgi:ectoine hydroxylase-related dioxygenase (phytanoyl-CoA dioxygenase family)
MAVSDPVATLDAHRQQQLDADGYLILEDVLSPQEVSDYRERLLAQAASEPGRNNPTQHVRWLVNKGADYRKLLLHPATDPWFRHLLGDDYTLSTLTSNVVRPGAPDGRYHSDFLDRVPEPLPEYALTANSLWLLDEFTADNGGTRLVPGSHRWRSKPPKDLANHPNEIRVSAPAGSVLLFNGALWHSSGANQTGRERVCLICFCLRSFLKPQFDFVNYLSDEAYAAATPELRRLYGFTSWPQAADDGALPSRRA